MIKFRHDYLEPSDFVSSNAGERFQEVYELEDPNGSEFEIKRSNKKFDIQEHINCFADSVDINNIVDRFTKGDFTAIPVPDYSGKFIDISGLPDNIHELREMADALYEVYDSLSPEQKSTVGDFNDFIAGIDNNNLNLSNEIKDIEVIEKTE